MTRFAELQHARTAYDDRGEGPVIVLLHGAEANRHSFDALAGALAPAARVINYDQRDCGETLGPRNEHQLADLANDAAELMVLLGHARYSVMGTSLGGRVAQVLALAHPQRLERLVLCNTWPVDRVLSEVNPQGTARLQALRAGLPATGRELAEMFYTPAHVHEHPALAGRFNSLKPASRRSALALQTCDFPRERLQMPVLCISGSEDRIVPPGVMRALADSLPRARWAALQGVGHSAAVQAPAALARLIADFLHEPRREEPRPSSTVHIERSSP